MTGCLVQNKKTSSSAFYKQMSWCALNVHRKNYSTGVDLMRRTDIRELVSGFNQLLSMLTAIVVTSRRCYSSSVYTCCRHHPTFCLLKNECAYRFVPNQSGECIAFSIVHHSRTWCRYAICSNYFSKRFSCTKLYLFVWKNFLLIFFFYVHYETTTHYIPEKNIFKYLFLKNISHKNITNRI